MRNSRRLASLLAFCGLALVLAGNPAQANFHSMKVAEVFPGTTAAPNAQYVVLQMHSSGQIFVTGHSITISDANGIAIANFAFAGSVANGANQATILIATAEAVSLFGVSADLTMAASLPLAGGKVCFDAIPIDCVGWGNYTPPSADATVGNPGPALVSGKAFQRRLDIAGGPTTLESADDTNSSANDFRFATPAPRNNAGQVGTVPASTCGNSAIEGLESCDDGGTESGDGCSAICFDEFCGDAVTNDADELCDDGNATSGDGCDVNCTLTSCGNGIVTIGEACELPNQGVCGPTCDVTATLTPVDWTTPTSGAAGTRTATLQFLDAPQIGSADLSGANFSAAPLSASAETLDYGTASDWSFAISQPANSILLYALNWRGTGGGINPVRYDFDAPFTILSGFEGAVVDDDDKQLILSADALYSGILQFVGPISSLPLQVNASASAEQAMTFALVPEPTDAMAIAVATLVALKFRSRQRRR